MAYLNTQLSKQELGVVVDGFSLIQTEQSTIEVIETVAEVGENSNFYIASQLKNEKSKLISSLSQFPVTALWLLNQYEQSVASGSSQEDDVTLDSEITTDISEISKYFYALSVKPLTDASYAADKQNLTTALELFPYSFHDLIKLVDVIVYAYKFRGLCYQPSICLLYTSPSPRD